MASYSKGSCFQLEVLLVLFFIKVIVAYNEELIRINRPVENDLDKRRLPDDVTCFCNLPACVGKGYLCKSERGCFSDLTSPLSKTPSSNPQSREGRHGCLEELSDWQHHKRQCQNTAGRTARTSISKEHPRSLLLCCFKDMCNHVDSPETRLRLNQSFMAFSLMMPNLTEESNFTPPPDNYNSEIWFRIATIAVPIFGAIILFLLIGIAVKILRADTMDMNIKLGDPYARSDRHSRDHFNHIHHPMNKKEPLLIHHNLESSSRGSCTNHNSEEMLKSTAVPLLVQNQNGYENRKNETNAKLNSAYGHEYNLLQADRLTSNLHKSAGSNVNNVYRNVNLTLENASDYSNKPATDEKLYDKQGLHTVVVSWPGDNSGL